MFFKIRKLVNDNKFFLPFVGICVSLLIILSVAAAVMLSKKETATVNNDAARLQYNDVNAKMQAENIKAFEITLKASFSKPQLIKIAQNRTIYSLTVNGTNVVKNTGAIYSERPTVAVMISENYGRDALKMLPRSIIELGSVMELKSASSLVKVKYGKAKLTTKLYNFYYGKSLSFLVSDLKSGDIITVEVLPEIAQKIGMEDNVIEIFYNKAS